VHTVEVSLGARLRRLDERAFPRIEYDEPIPDWVRWGGSAAYYAFSFLLGAAVVLHDSLGLLWIVYAVVGLPVGIAALTWRSRHRIRTNRRV